MKIRAFAALFVAFATLVLAAEKPAPESIEAFRKAFREKVRYTPSEYEVKVTAVEPAQTFLEQELPAGLIEERIEFPSPMKSVDPEINDTVRADLYRVEKPKPAAVIALAGWRGEPLTVKLGRLLATETGIQVLSVHVPFQQERTPKGRRSGDLTLSADLAQTEATFVQLVLDVQRAMEWLVKERGVDPERIGVMGLSLGGFVTASLYGSDGRFRSAVSQLAGADVADVLYNGNFLMTRIQAKLVEDGISEEEARIALRGLAPSTWADPEKKDGFLIVAAEDDTIVTLANAKALSDAFGGAEIEILEGAGHVAIAEITAAFPKVRDHLVKHLLPKTPPKEGEDE